MNTHELTALKELLQNHTSAEILKAIESIEKVEEQRDKTDMTKAANNPLLEEDIDNEFDFDFDSGEISIDDKPDYRNQVLKIQVYLFSKIENYHRKFPGLYPASKF